MSKGRLQVVLPEDEYQELERSARAQRVIFIDSNIPMYLVGAPHAHKSDAQRLLERSIVAGERLVTSAGVPQEILQRRGSTGRTRGVGPLTLAGGGRGRPSNIQARRRTMQVRSRMTSRWLTAALCLVPLVLACSSKQRLGEYEYRNRSLSLISIAPAHPEVLGGAAFRVDPARPVSAVLRVGSEIARELQKHQIRPRLDSAAMVVDVDARLSRQLLDNAARHLRAVPTPQSSTADYELEVRIRRYGIVASAWTAPAYFLIDADMTLLDGSTGRRIWRGRVQQSDPVRPYVITGSRTVSNTVSAIALANMSVDDLSRQLENLADYAANSMSSYFARSLDQARR